MARENENNVQLHQVAHPYLTEHPLFSEEVPSKAQENLYLFLFLLCLIQVVSKYMERDEVSAHIEDLESDTEYVICIIILYEDQVDYQELIYMGDQYDTLSDNNTKVIKSQEIVESILMKHPASECVTFDTYKNPVVVKLKSNREFNLSEILNRRLGLMVGCGLGFIVFFIMVSILLYTKFKERKRIAETEPVWAEMNEYHSVHSKEEILNSTTASTDNILLGIGKSRNYSLN